ncbi:MAG: DUF6022 family protein [Fimbriimonas sp.]
MSTVQDGLSTEERADIFALGRKIQNHFAENAAPMLEENAEVLNAAYEKAGDAAYGVYLGLLYRPIRRQMEAAGLRAAPAFPGDFDASREWGNEDETDNQRWMWTVIENADGQPLGSIVTIAHHSHARFEIPRPPEILALRETEKADVERALSQRSTDFANAEEFSVWYANYLKQS